MELSVNLFNKGLQMDTHPMVLGNDTLSDCLNGTMITMSGNEVVLQNDMGNRRVDNAFLPAGYEPVGIKEYGGIIYLALYNPITNKSQIGSFPSPERKINSLDDNNLGGEFKFNDFNIGYNETSLNDLKCLQSDFVMIPLTKDTSLHAGDKFVVYLKDNEIYSNENNISNFNNINNGKVKSPKNKLYTLLLGILNSLNEFVDVTKSLVRWDDNGNIIEFDDNTSDLVKFNSGYFIAPSFNKPTSDLTKSDTELIQERQTYPANTYAYKLVGPLYLKVQLNHILSFNYNIYSLKNENGVNSWVDLWVEAYITYNCPDYVTNINGTEKDDNYSTYDEGIPNFNKFNVFDLIGEFLSLPSIEEPDNKCKYDPSTNLYSIKIVKKYKLNKITGIFEYKIGVDSGLKENGLTLYLRELSDTGQINLDLIGSGAVELTTWRFLNNINTKESTITYAFLAYPQYGKSFSDFKFIFTPYDINGHLFDNDSSKIEVPAQLYNGRVDLYIDWEKRGFTPRTMYKVTWSYNDGNRIVTPNKGRWFLTTELYNSCYNLSLAEGVNDFGSQEASGILEKYNKIDYTLNSNNTGYIVSTLESSDKGILSKTSSSFDIKYKTELNIKINLNYSLEYNLNNYPNYISESEGELSSKINVNDNDILTESLEPLWEISFDNEPTVLSPTFTNILSSSTTITGKINNYDLLYIQTLTNEGKIIKNGFRSFYDYLSNYIRDLGNLMRYGGIGLHCESLTGSRDNHYIDLYISSNENILYHGHWSGNPTDAVRIAEDDTDSHKIFKYNDVLIASAILDGFNAANYNILFLWAYRGVEGIQFMNNSSNDSEGYLDTSYARVWWRTSNGTWALFPRLKEKSNSIYNFISNLIKIKDYHFAYYKQAALSEHNLYAPKEFFRTKEYSTPFTIKWTPKIKENKTIFTTKNPDNPSYCNFFPEYKEKEDNTYEFNSQQCVFEIKTSENFNNLVIIAGENIFENIDLDTLKMLDINKTPLNPNNLYIKNSDSNLIEYPDDNIGIIESGNNRYLVYNKVIKGTPEQRYDTYKYDDEDSHTSLDYDGVNVVTL